MFRQLGELKNNSIYDYNFNGSMHWTISDQYPITNNGIKPKLSSIGVTFSERALRSANQEDASDCTKR